MRACRKDSVRPAFMHRGSNRRKAARSCSAASRTPIRDSRDTRDSLSSAATDICRKALIPRRSDSWPTAQPDCIEASDRSGTNTMMR
jgi:hypothetical protein